MSPGPITAFPLVMMITYNYQGSKSPDAMEVQKHNMTSETVIGVFVGAT